MQTQLNKSFFKELEEINQKPEAFESYTAESLWTDEHRSKQMLQYHLNQEIDLASRNKNFIEDSVNWIEKKFFKKSQTKVCDFGCAVGLYTTKFAERGANVTGIDFSKNSLEYAKNRAKEQSLDIEYIHQNYLDFHSDKKFDLITMIMCDFSVLSPAQREILLKKFYNLLEENGTIVLDCSSLKAFDEKQEETTYEKNHLYGFWSSEEYYCFVNSYKYEQQKVSLDKYTVITQKKKEVVYNWFQYYSLEMIKEEFEKANLEVVEVYSDVCGNPYSEELGEFAVVVKKR